MTSDTKQVLLIVLDGWGYREDTKYNAIAQANPTFFNSLWNTYPHTLFEASGESVGLPKGTIGTSEIGHMTMGAGKIIDTDIVRINKAIADNTLKDNHQLNEVFSHVKNHNSTLHLMGLLSPGGVHSHQDHLFALIRLAKAAEIQDVAIHVFTDGRDTAPKSAEIYIRNLEDVISEVGIGRIASISGRYYAMDRDKNWERTQKAEDALFLGHGEITQNSSPVEVILKQYEKEVTDEFIIPSVLSDSDGKPMCITENDGVLFFNFRPDRARQLSQKIMEKVSDMNLSFATMTEYDESLKPLILFPPEKIMTTLSSEIAKAGLKQVHIAETEKYAHVTYFFNGGNEEKHPDESFIMIESRKDIATHDLAPEMKAKEIVDKAMEAVENNIPFIAINLANADMVGHTGKMEPTIKAVQCIDHELSRLIPLLLKNNGVAFITADHGNAELLYDEEKKQPYTAHTLNPVPAIITKENITIREHGTLADVAPTILKLLGLPKPEEMTGESLY